jgi:hypothetical protein
MKPERGICPKPEDRNQPKWKIYTLALFCCTALLPGEKGRD